MKLIKSLVKTIANHRDRSRYNVLVDQGKNEGGLTPTELTWMNKIWLANKDELSKNKGYFK